MEQRFCPTCGQPTVHANVAETARLAHVSRTTLYTWIRRALVHGVVQPSGRKLICVDALAVPLEARDDPPARGRPAAGVGRTFR
jgi:transposase-like protein